MAFCPALLGLPATSGGPSNESPEGQQRAVLRGASERLSVCVVGRALGQSRVMAGDALTLPCPLALSTLLFPPLLPIPSPPLFSPPPPPLPPPHPRLVLL